jgi:hypothetical protein
MPGWGWLEWVLLSQAALPALMFVPGLAATRIVTRIAVFTLPLLAWGVVGLSGRRPPGGRPFPAVPWADGGRRLAGGVGPATPRPTRRSRGPSRR